MNIHDYDEYKDEKIKEYNEDFIKKFGVCLCDFDPWQINIFEDTFDQYEELVKKLKKDKKLKPPLNRCEVHGWNFPVFCSPSFLDQLGFQLQEQIERILGIKEIHKLQSAEIKFSPFYSVNRFYPFGNVFFFNECIDDVWYSYCQCNIRIFVRGIWDAPDPIVWVRFRSLKNPLKVVSTEEEATAENIMFEICDEVPKSFPPPEKLPDFVKEMIAERCKADFCRYEKSFIEETYNPVLWKEQLKSFLNYFIEKDNKKKARKAVKKNIKNQVSVDIMPSIYDYFPDISYTMDFEHEITEDAVDIVLDLIEDCVNSLEENEYISFYDAEKTGDKQIELTIDFGSCSPSYIIKISNLLRKNIPSLIRITIN